MEENPLSASKNEMSIGDLLIQIRSTWSFLISKWYLVFFASLLGALLGLGVAFLVPVKYVSRQTFIVEESKSSSGLASLAGQFGFDIGSIGSGGFFSGENIILFLKSESLCRETLMTNYDKEGKEVLADRFAESHGLKKSWKKNKKIGEINFAQYKGKDMPRLEDSLMQLIINKEILVKALDVAKPDKKASFVTVTTYMRDELLSKYFSERLVEIATKRYIDSKIKVKAANVAILQRRADSLANLLDSKTFTAAYRQQSLVDVNPAFKTIPIEAEISSREKTMIATIFAEVVKNLEISKTIMNQETPAIQMVDQSSLPLERDKFGKLVSLLIGGTIAGFLSILSLLVSRWLKAQI